MDGLEAGSVFAEDYEVVRTVYTGGLSTIYEVRQKSTGAKRALKVVLGALGGDERVRSAFLEEARKASRIQSEHVAEVVAWGCDPESGAPFVAMELLEGKRLSQHVDEKGPMSPPEVLGFMTQLCHALGAAHAVNVVHRDLKPEGIVLASSPSSTLPYRVEVQFVGVGKIASEIRQNTTAAMSRGLWMAPEQAETNATVTPATDVWTVGLLAFWLLTGKSYWKTARDMGSAMVGLMREVLFDPIVAASARARELGVEGALPAGFDAWFARCVARQPEKRFQSATEAANALAQVLAARFVTETPAHRPPAEPRRPVPAAAIQVMPAPIVAPLPPKAAAPSSSGALMSIPGPSTPLRAAAPVPEAPAVTIAGSATPAPAPSPAPAPAPVLAPTPSPVLAPTPAPAVTVLTPLAAPPPEAGPPPPPAPTFAQRAAASSAGARKPVKERPRKQRSEGDTEPEEAAPRPSRKIPWLPIGIATVLLVGLCVGGVYGYDAYEKAKRKERRALAAEEDKQREAEREAKKEEARKKKKALEEWSDEDSPVPVSYKDPMWGERTAPVTVVAFTGFACTPCIALDTALARVKLEYGRTDVRVVWKHFPGKNERAKAAAVAAQAVFQIAKADAFFTFTNSVYSSSSTDLLDYELADWALTAGGKRSSDYEKARTDSKTTKKVDEDIALATRIGVKKAPVVFVNGVPVAGQLTFDRLKPVIDEQLTKARAKTAPADKLYVTLSKEQFSPVQASSSAAPASSVFRVPLDGSAVAGPTTALVTIVGFSDIQCEHCATAHATIEALRAKYPDRIRYVHKDRPLSNHARSRAAAAFLREVRAQKGDDAFFKGLKLLYENRTALEDSDLKGYAKTLGVDADKALTAIQDAVHEPAIAKDEALAEALDVSGTPHFFINGRRVIGSKSASDLEIIVDELEKEAKAKVASGTAADSYYAEIMKTARPDALELRIVDPGQTPYSAPKLGASYASLSVQVFCDLTSPDCKTMEPILQKISEKNSNVNVVFRHLPSDESDSAKLLAQAATEIQYQLGDAYFFKFLDGWYLVQGEKHADLRAKLKQIAQQTVDSTFMSFDPIAFDSAIDTNKHEWKIKADVEKAEELGFTGAPTIIVGKYAFTGTTSYAKLQSLVDRALKEGP